MQGRCTLLIDDCSWRVARVGAEGVLVESVALSGDSTLADQAGAAAELIQSIGGGSIVLALASSDCLSASIVIDGLARSGRRQAVGYLLEEQLPISAEDAVADYVELQGVGLGVCTELSKLAPIVEALDASGVRIQHICPAALLIAQHLAEQHPRADALLMTSDTDASEVDLVELTNKQPRRWWWLTDEQALADQLKALADPSNEEGRPVLVVTQHRAEFAAFEQIEADLDMNVRAAALQADRILAGDVSPWIDLRRGALAAPDASKRYQKQIGGLVAAGVLLLLCLGGAMFWRGMGYEQQAKRLRMEQITVYKQAFPDSRVPSGSVLGRMRSELQRLEGIGGQAGTASLDSDDAVNRISALTHLYNVLTALPGTLRYQVSDIRIEPNLIHFEGQAESSVVAEQVARALRSAGTYEVDPPSSRALSDFGVSFNVFARPKARKPEVTP